MSWDDAYARGWAPWEVGHAQPAFVALAERADIRSPVLDSGCGTGENALMLAGLGFDVVGVDIAPTAIAIAREKARRRGLAAQFAVGDVLALSRQGRQFATVIDSGMFHTLDDRPRERYVESLAGAVVAGGVVHLLCFSDRTPGTTGPRRITRAELRAAFAEGWTVERIDESHFDVTTDFLAMRPHAWLARIVREPAAGRAR